MRGMEMKSISTPTYPPYTPLPFSYTFAFDITTKQHAVMKEWCLENIGERFDDTMFEVPKDARWFSKWVFSMFYFRTEADLTMFILRFAGACD